VKVLVASRGVVPIEAGCGGAEIVAYQLAKNMAESGHDVTFVADLDPTVFEPTVGLNVVPVGGRIQALVRRLPAGLPRWMLQHLFGNLAVARTVRKILRRQGDLYAVIHTHGALSTILISWGTGTPLIYTEHDATPWSCRYRRWYERWIRKLIYRVVNVTAFKRADHVVTNFELQAKEIVRRWGLPGSKVVVISNGTDAHVFKPVEAVPSGGSRIRERFGFDRYCLFVGSLTPRKSPDLLLEAVAEAGVSCVFAGDGPMRRKLERRAHQLGIAHRVAFLGGVPPNELGRIYSEADLLVLPTVSDTSPLVALEAMACGTPVLASRVSGLPGMIEDWKTGFLVKPGDVGQLTMAIRFLTGDARLRRRMGKNGQKRVREFLWPAVTDRYLSLFLSAHSEWDAGRASSNGAQVVSA
jgi:glycosyltransferase involved in cell wall biosynthesis